MAAIRSRLCGGSACLLCIFVFATTSSAQRSCLKYEPSVIQLKGILLRKTYPGPPNYEDVMKGDRPETYWLLSLVQPICVNKDSHNPDINVAYKNVHSIELVLPNSEYYRKHANLVGHKVLAIGTLLGQITTHHHTHVLLTVSSIKRDD